MKTVLRFLFPALAMAFLGFPSATAQGIVYVKTPGAAAPDGTSWAKAFGSLQAALDKVNASGGTLTQIWVAEGTYKPTAAISGGDVRTKTFAMLEGVALYGGFAGSETSLDQRQFSAHPTILSGDLAGNDGAGFTNNSENAYHVVRAFSSNLSFTLDGFIVRSGNANGGSASGSDYDYGGAIHCKGKGTPILRNCAFEANSCEWNGGAVYIFFTTTSDLLNGPVIENCVFRGNRASKGGGAAIYLNPDSTLQKARISDSYFSKNTSGELGGAVFLVASVTVVRCAFESNVTKGGWGGALASVQGFPFIVDCHFVGNSALGPGTLPADGGAIHFGQGNEGGAMTIANCEFRANVAAGRGGAVWVQTSGINGSSPIVNCTLAGNSAAEGGAVYANFASGLRLRNSILWGNLAPLGSQIQQIGSTIEVSSCDVQGGYAGSGNIAVDPKFEDGASGDLRLAQDSPCIDAGKNAYLPLDQADLDSDGDIVETIPLDLADAARLVHIPTILDTGVGTPAIVDLGAYEFWWPGLGNYGTLSSYCGTTPTIYGDSIPHLGNASFHLVADNAPPGTTGLAIVGDVASAAATDNLGLGVNLWIDLASSSTILGFDFPVAGDGIATASIPIPNHPAFAGTTAFAQGIFLYPNPCPSSPFSLGVTDGLRVTLLP
jgi:hypothetical protein